MNEDNGCCFYVRKFMKHIVDEEAIFRFWNDIGLSEKIHPADRQVFRSVGKKGHGFHLKCLPSPINGRLRTAPVVFLFLSPGYNPKDLKDAKSIKGKKNYQKRRQGLQPISDSGSGANWFSGIISKFEIDRLKAFDQIAVLNIGAYHSKKYKDYPLLAALPSSRMSLDWAQQILFPQARRGKRVVVCLQSAHFWGLKPGSWKGKLFVPEVTRGGHMRRKSKRQKEMRRKVVKAIQKILS